MGVLNEQKKSAARMLVNGASAAAAARELGVNRATIGRWKEEPDFQAFTAELLEESQEEAQEGLRSRVPAALQLIDRFFAGDSTIPANRATVALNVIKAAASIDKGAGEAGETAFEERLRQLDARNA